MNSRRLEGVETSCRHCRFIKLNDDGNQQGCLANALDAVHKRYETTKVYDEMGSSLLIKGLCRSHRPVHGWSTGDIDKDLEQLKGELQIRFNIFIDIKESIVNYEAELIDKINQLKYPGEIQFLISHPFEFKARSSVARILKHITAKGHLYRMVECNPELTLSEKMKEVMQYMKSGFFTDASVVFPSNEELIKINSVINDDLETIIYFPTHRGNEYIISTAFAMLMREMDYSTILDKIPVFTKEQNTQKLI